jgi:hypothetical protein
VFRKLLREHVGRVGPGAGAASHSSAVASSSLCIQSAESGVVSHWSADTGVRPESASHWSGAASSVFHNQPAGTRADGGRAGDGGARVTATGAPATAENNAHAAAVWGGHTMSKHSHAVATAAAAAAAATSREIGVMAAAALGRLEGATSAGETYTLYPRPKTINPYTLYDH